VAIFCRIDLLLSPLDDVEDFAGNVTFDAPDCLELGMPLVDSLFDVGLVTGIDSQIADRNDMQRAVCGPVAAAVRAMPAYLSRRCWYRADAT
jgi:hypothetical protein